MRTKTLLIAAATALAAGIVTSQAQVYSQNIVGYVNATLPAGYTLLVSPLSPNSTNDAQSVLPSLAVGDVLFVWNGGGYNLDLYYGPGQWYDDVTYASIPVPTLAPGQGFFYENNSGATETNTFVGTVQLTNSVSLASGYSLVGSTAPVSDFIDGTNLSLPLAIGDVVFLWNGGGYNIDLYYGPGQWYDDVSYAAIPDPTVGVGQGFFYQNNTGTAKTWTQNVVVQ
jgi:hypothetical protein